MQKIVVSLLLVCLFNTSFVCGQDLISLDSIPQRETSKKALRASNSVTAAIGFAVANGDYDNTLFELNAHIGYKRFVSPNFNIGFTYHKFNIAFEDVYNQGFMSFDLNLEYVLFADKAFTPFVFAGPGFNAANYFEESDFKFQAGAGVEYLVSNGFGLKLQTDWNLVSSDLLDGLEAGASNDSYFRISLGANIYFPLRGGGSKRKDDPSFIDSNLIEY